MAVSIDGASDLKRRLQEAGNKLVVINFYSTWCGPCRMTGPAVEEIAYDLAGNVVMLMVDVDECEDLAAEYGINSIPTFVFVRKSKILGEFSGANISKLKRWIYRNK